MKNKINKKTLIFIIITTVINKMIITKGGI